jgi:hypothetical protein
VRSRRSATATRRWVAAIAGTGGLVMMVSSLLPWIGTGTEDGGRTTISGWGSISGDSEIAGTNLNDVLDGTATYRPGLPGVLFGVLAVIAAIVLAAAAGGAAGNRRPHRVTGALLVLCGLVGTGWGLYRGIKPGDAGVFEAGDVSVGIGPWLTALGGVLTIGAAAVIFAGRIDSPDPVARRGIQPR